MCCRVLLSLLCTHTFLLDWLLAFPPPLCLLFGFFGWPSPFTLLLRFHALPPTCLYTLTGKYQNLGFHLTPGCPQVTRPGLFPGLQTHQQSLPLALQVQHVKTEQSLYPLYHPLSTALPSLSPVTSQSPWAPSSSPFLPSLQPPPAHSQALQVLALTASPTPSPALTPHVCYLACSTSLPAGLYPGFSTLLALGWLYLLKISPRLLLAFWVKNSSLEVVLAASLLAAPHHPHTHALCSNPSGPPAVPQVHPSLCSWVNSPTLAFKLCSLECHFPRKPFPRCLGWVSIMCNHLD